MFDPRARKIFCRRKWQPTPIFLPGKYYSFPGGSDGKASACNAGDSGSIPGSGRSPGEGNTMDRRAWQATVHGVAKESNMT